MLKFSYSRQGDVIVLFDYQQEPIMITIASKQLYPMIDKALYQAITQAFFYGVATLLTRVLIV